MAEQIWKFLKKRGFVLTALIVAGCIDDPGPIEQDPVGHVAIYHGAPDAPGLNVIIDDQKANTSAFDYQDYIEYSVIPAGNRSLKFSSTSSPDVLIDTTLSVGQNKVYSLFVINGPFGLQSMVLQDSVEVLGLGKAMMRFVHISPDSPLLELYVNGETDAPLFTGIPRFGATAFKEVEAKPYTLQVREAGGNGDVIVSRSELLVKAGGYYTIVVEGFETPPAGNTHGLSVKVL